MPALLHRRWTEEEVRQLIDDAPGHTPRYELVDGELLVTPSPNQTHQRVVVGLVVRLFAYLETQRIGEVLVSPSDVRLAPELVVQPDVYVAPFVAGRPRPAPDRVATLLLAVEVISPSSARYDRVVKRRAFQATGVPEYWIVDADARTVERWRPADVRPEVLDASLSWQPTEASASFELDIRDFFAGICDDV